MGACFHSSKSKSEFNHTEKKTQINNHGVEVGKKEAQTLEEEKKFEDFEEWEGS
jgi:hypothetical protein